MSEETIQPAETTQSAETAQPAETAETAKPNNKKKLAIIIVCIVALVLVVCVAVVFALNEKNKQDHMPVQIAFTFEAAGYDPQTGTGVPLHIEGTDLDGKQVSETALVDQGAANLDLLRGTYDITVAGSPVSGSGGVYSIPGAVTHIEINEKEVVINGEATQIDQGEGQVVEAPTIAFTAIKPAVVTDEQIAAIKGWMEEVDFSSDTITKFTDLIVANRKAGLEKIEAEKLAAWRTKLTGTFDAQGAYAGPIGEKATISFSGEKFVVRGALSRWDGSNFTSLKGSEWHFLLTDQTKYYWSSDYDYPASKSEFVELQPDNFVALSIEVKDGYVTSMSGHS